MSRLCMVAAGLVCALGVAGGCEREVRAPGLAPEPEEPIRASEAGIEVLSWAADDSSGAIGRALAPFSAATAEGMAPAWRSAGLRLLRVPRGRLDAIAGAMPTVGPLQRQWFGMLSAWTPITTGRAWSGRLQVTVEGGVTAERLSLGPGRLRLLARCWSEPSVNAEGPGAAASAALRVEVVPQHEEAGGSEVAVSAGRRTDQTLRGHVFESLELSFVAEAGFAYVIVPETPGAEWAVTEDASNDQPLGPPPAAEDATGARLPPTLGEAMLSDAPSGGMARTRVIVVLSPRVPERFELLRVGP